MEKLNTKEFLKEYNAGRKDFSNCDLRGLILKPCDLSAIIFNGANLSNSFLNSCIFKNAQFVCADLSNCSLIGADFQNAEMDTANLSGSTLIQANLDGANLNAGILNRANLKKASLNKTKLNNALLQDVILEMACLNNTLLFKADLYKANLQGCSLEGAFLEKADLRYANLINANFKGAIITNAQFINTMEQWSKINHKDNLLAKEMEKPSREKFLKEFYNGRRDFSNCDLRGLKLGFAALEYVNFSNSDLSEVDFNHASLIGVNFKNANLTKTNLYRANLEDANLEGTILANTDLTKANLNKVIAKPSGSSTNVKDKSLKSKIELKCKEVGKEIIFRSTISNAVFLGQATILELLSLLGVKKRSKFYKFFANNIGNVVVKTSAGLFLKYCPFTQEEKYQSIANELLTQVGVSSMKEARNILIGFIPQAKKLVGMVEALMEEKPVTRIAISENKPEISEEIQEEEQLIEDKELYIQ